ncbi:MAG: polysaccharide deacetylase, partial [Clostridium sp.]
MKGFEDFNEQDKEKTIEECLKAINDTQNKMAEEEEMKKLIRETLSEINEKENKIRKNKIIHKYIKIKKKLDNELKIIETLLSKKKYKKISMRIMIFFVFSIFMFNGALSRAYANGKYSWSSIIDSEGTDSESSGMDDENEKEDENILGVNSEGKEYSYDAVEICDKLKKGDYSNN